MIIYNVTVSVEEDIVDDWLKWMQEVHIPEIMTCGIFTEAKIHRVIVQEDSDNTFAIAYTCASMKELHQYQIKFAPALQKKHNKIFKEKAIAFRTILHLIKDF